MSTQDYEDLSVFHKLPHRVGKWLKNDRMRGAKRFRVRTCRRIRDDAMEKAAGNYGILRIACRRMGRKGNGEAGRSAACGSADDCSAAGRREHDRRNCEGEL